jgi:hypothetical protein
MQKLSAEFLLELLDLPAERRLGNVEFFRRTAEAALGRNGHEIA